MERPANGTMVYWHHKKSVPWEWMFGYVTHEGNGDLIRMGRWNGDDWGGRVVSASQIEWRPYETER